MQPCSVPWPAELLLLVLLCPLELELPVFALELELLMSGEVLV